MIPDFYYSRQQEIKKNVSRRPKDVSRKIGSQGKGVVDVLKKLFYLLGSIVMLLALDSKIHELTGRHLYELAGYALSLLKGGSPWTLS
jgi:hypothetical protein